jgi:transposase
MPPTADRRHRSVPSSEVATTAQCNLTDAEKPEIAVAFQQPASARQVADRWHLIENASAAFLDSMHRSMRRIREAIGAATVDRNLLTAAERRQHDGFLRRQDTNAIIHRLAEAGTAIKEIVRTTGHSRKLVREVVRGGRTDVFRVRSSSLEAFLPQLEIEWTAGCRNGAQLWRHLKAAGFRGAPRVVSEWATRRRRSESAPGMLARKPPSARTIARFMTGKRDQLSTADATLIAVVERAVPALGAARDLVGRFQTILRSKTSIDLDAWLSDAATSLLGGFARGIAADRDAVEAAITEPWSNGQTEGQINKLKLLKRQMYGRAKLDLLRARLCAA